MKIAFIPARGGSKRIPRKNIKNFCGKPMIAWSIEAAKKSMLFERIIVSTDDEEIAEISKDYGAEVPFLRPASLSDDHVGLMDVVSHFSEWIINEGHKVEALCLIYATAPFILPEDLRRGIDYLNSGDWAYALGVTDFPAPVFRSFSKESNGSLKMFFPEHFKTRSQDLPIAYHDAGQFCWARPYSWIKKIPPMSEFTIGVEIPRWRVQDIDTQDDWIRAEILAPGIIQYHKP